MCITSARPIAAPCPGRVLIVEADPETRALIRDTVVLHGFAPLEAASAEEALLLVERSAPSLALVDFRLPDMSGGELLRRLRGSANLALRTLPVIELFSGADLWAAGELGAIDGAACLLRKPVRARELARTITWALDVYLRT